MSPTEVIKSYFSALNDSEKEEIIRFIINRIPKGRKLKDIMGFSSKDKTFDLDVVDGQASEFAFLNIATSGKHEVKRDFKASQTGNIAVEVECNGRPSGITATKSPYWVYWLSGEEFQDEVAIIMTISRLRRIAQTCQLVSGGDGGKAKMHLITLRKLLYTNKEIKQEEKRNGAQMALPLTVRRMID